MLTNKYFLFHSLMSNVCWKDQLSDLCNRFYRKAMLVGCSVLFFQQMGGFYFFESCPIIILNGNFKKEVIYSSYFCLLFSLLGFLYLNRWGRKSLFIIGLIVSVVCHLTSLVLLPSLSEETIHYLLIPNTIAVGSYVTIYGPICWIYAAEILPDIGFALAMSFNWLGWMFVTLFNINLTILMLNEMKNQYEGFMIFGCIFFSIFTIIGIIVVWIFARETKGLSDIEIKYLYVPAGVDRILSASILDS